MIQRSNDGEFREGGKNDDPNHRAVIIKRGLFKIVVPGMTIEDIIASSSFHLQPGVFFCINVVKEEPKTMY